MIEVEINVSSLLFVLLFNTFAGGDGFFQIEMTIPIIPFLPTVLSLMLIVTYFTEPITMESFLQFNCNLFGDV